MEPGTKQKSASGYNMEGERWGGGFLMRLLKQVTPNGWLISAPQTFTGVEQWETPVT